jgi:hypothetical protein
VLVVAWLAAITVLFPPPAFAVLPPQLPHVEDEVDVLWLDHYYDESGRLVLDQVICLDWSAQNGLPQRHNIVAWRRVKTPDGLPFRTQDGYRVIWWDGSLLRDIRANAFRETWSQAYVTGDPEVAEREMLPKELRRELSQPAFRQDKPAGAIRPFVREFPATQ